MTGELCNNHTRMCVSKSEGNGSFIWLQMNEMNEKISFKMGMKFAASVYIGKGFPHVWHLFVCKRTEGELQSVLR